MDLWHLQKVSGERRQRWVPVARVSSVHRFRSVTALRCLQTPGLTQRLARGKSCTVSNSWFMIGGWSSNHIFRECRHRSLDTLRMFFPLSCLIDSLLLSVPAAQKPVWSWCELAKLRWRSQNRADLHQLRIRLNKHCTTERKFLNVHSEKRDHRGQFCSTSKTDVNSCPTIKLKKK